MKRQRPRGATGGRRWPRGSPAGCSGECERTSCRRENTSQSVSNDHEAIPGWQMGSLEQPFEKLPLTIGLLVFPFRSPKEEAGQPYLGEFIGLLSPIAREVLVMVGNYDPDAMPGNVEIANVGATTVKGYEESFMSRVCRLLRAQFSLSLKLLRLRKRVDVVILLNMTGPLVLPVVVARILRKKTVVAMAGCFYQHSKTRYRPPLAWIVPPGLWLIEQIDYALATKIVVPSLRMIDDLGIKGYGRRKVIAAHVLTSYLDLKRFSIRSSLAERGNVIGFVGRMYPAKGVMELAKAIPLVLLKRNDIRFMIVGDGPLMEDMKQDIRESGCLDNVSFESWVPHDQIQEYFNRMRFLILPSYKELLGAVTIQAMACGAIVIAKSYGAIPDVVVESRTGFLLEDNSPQTIADKIVEVWDHPELQAIQQEARATIEQTFSKEKVSDGWRHILLSL